MPGPFRATCPHCAATIVVMSDIAPTLPMTEPPLHGDVVRCDRCSQLCAVGSVEGDLVRVIKIEIRPDLPQEENAWRIRKVLS